MEEKEKKKIDWDKVLAMPDIAAIKKPKDAEKSITKFDFNLTKIKSENKEKPQKGQYLKEGISFLSPPNPFHKRAK